MKRPPSGGGVARRTRRWRVPPPLTRGSELLEGAAMLAELSGPSAVLLWKSARNVTLWAAGASRDGTLFSPGAQQQRLAELAGAELDSALRAPLEALSAVLGPPAEVDRDAVAAACQSIAAWADARGASATALEFAQAAALACPEAAQFALAVGRLARGRAEHARSESWFRRAIMLGRQNEDWEVYARAHMSLGTLFFLRGNFPLARRAHVKALRAARRKGLRELMGMAYHDLMAIEVECENSRRAQEYAAAAMRAYGAGHPRLPALAHDTAALWALQGEFARALPVFQAVLPHLDRPAERLLVLSNTARAAAGAGHPDRFADLWDQVWQTTAGAETGEGFAQALLNLAHGALLLADQERAEQAGARAEQIAAARGESQIRLEAETLLDAVRQRRTLAERTAAPRGESLPAEQADRLATELIRRVRRSALSA